MSLGKSALGKGAFVVVTPKTSGGGGGPAVVGMVFDGDQWWLPGDVEFADLKELFDHNDFVHGVAPEVEETKADGEEVDEINFFVEFADLKELFDHNDFVHGIAPEVEETKADGEEVNEINFF
ncbi:hypothetical protein Tco_1156111 [Tanacetum coccineum]